MELVGDESTVANWRSSPSSNSATIIAAICRCCWGVGNKSEANDCGRREETSQRPVVSHAARSTGWQVMATW